MRRRLEVSDDKQETPIHQPDSLTPLDRALLAEAILRTNLAAHGVRDAQATLLAARAKQNELTATLSATYGLADGDVMDPESGVISRAHAKK
jgi:hypothetical protein